MERPVRRVEVELDEGWSEEAEALRRKSSEETGRSGTAGRDGFVAWAVL